MDHDLWFVAPPLDGPVTGGTLYNREIVRAMAALGASVKRLDPEAACQALAAGVPGRYLVDTLYLREFSQLREENRSHRPLTLLCHFLPSLVHKGESLTLGDLENDERYALEAADAFVVPSDFMRQTLARLDPRSRPTLVVEPATLATGLGPVAAGSGVLRAAVVANLTQGKGVEPFLSALARQASPDDAFELEVIGSHSADPGYAEACVRAAAGDPRVRFVQPLEPLALISRLAESKLLISASRMESFGMALAEARTLGIPIAARGGGNVASHVDPAWGGELCADETALALAFLLLCRDQGELGRRTERARHHARAPRNWCDAARELLAQAPRLERDAYEK